MPSNDQEFGECVVITGIVSESRNKNRMGLEVATHDLSRIRHFESNNRKHNYGYAKVSTKVSI